MKCKNLEVWKRSCRLSVEIYKYFKMCVDYGFKDQITRSSLSDAGKNVIITQKKLHEGQII